jgi:hypothetical protein
MAENPFPPLAEDDVVIDLGELGKPGSGNIRTAAGTFAIGGLLRQLIGKRALKGWTGERKATRALHLAILHLVYTGGVNPEKTVAQRRLIELARDRAEKLQLDGWDLLDPENGSHQEIAGDSLKALRITLR